MGSEQSERSYFQLFNRESPACQQRPGTASEGLWNHVVGSEFWAPKSPARVHGIFGVLASVPATPT